MLIKLIFDVFLKQKKEVAVEEKELSDSKLVSISFQTLLSFVSDKDERESITVDSVSDAAFLEEFKRKNSVPSVELRVKALYLYFISNFVELIDNNRSLFVSPTMELQNQDSCVDGLFIRLSPNYVPDSFTDLREGRISSLAKHNAGHLKNIFNTLVMNYWHTCQLKFNRELGHTNCLVYSKMLSLFEQCSSLNYLENYMFNLLAPSLMPLYYRFKNDNIPFNAVIAQLDEKLTTMAKNKEPTSDIFAPKPSVSNLIAEILIFDFPCKESIFDLLRKDWQKERPVYCVFFGDHFLPKADTVQQPINPDPSTFDVENIFGST